MKLVDLKARWMRLNGKAVAIIFQCPRCVKRGNGCHGRGLTWLTCTFKVLDNRTQRELIASTIEADRAHFGDIGEHEVVGCKPLAWQRDVKMLETITVSPSLDAGPAGHWHGHIQQGQIRGGL